MNIDIAKHMLKSYSGMTHKMTDNNGRPKLDQAIETILNELEKKDKVIEQMVTYIMTHSSVPTLRHRFCPNYEMEECRIDCNDMTVKSKCIKEYYYKKVEV